MAILSVPPWSRRVSLPALLRRPVLRDRWRVPGPRPRELDGRAAGATQCLAPGPRSEIKQLLQKALDLDAVPILIARRIAFVTFYVLNWCGVLVHETYNQLYPNADKELAELVKNKRLLGYHDVRVGNEPDVRLSRFTTEHLVPLLPEAMERNEEFRDLLEDYASGGQYEVFAGKVLRRVRRRAGRLARGLGGRVSGNGVLGYQVYAPATPLLYVFRSSAPPLSLPSWR